jgi:hypothetical protein
MFWFKNITPSRAEERRKAVRLPTCLDVEICIDGEKRCAVITDLNKNGFSLFLQQRLRVGEIAVLHHEGLGEHAARAVWYDGEQAGCQFIEPVDPGEINCVLAQCSLSLSLEEIGSLLRKAA